ncbi:High-affinity zinc uptake system membrane protein ZnuB [Anaerohalosphaera lusitana]|uniref:High-affinity zinc uptake system membrane protein ZnuB n=1 Tax=Anaerohalosphaera lusitana TaxID=1936003 RepID=A0A1U9NPB1_9BACT|nr:metal ABC transporter permease [Anaerohalosphaera lusitana]AQT69753.1 High-affinity zinc uptake system membrane protein ZnuB [Anaerohalosphaera lusitana]
MDIFFLPVIIAGIMAGASIGLLGVYIVGIRMPFIGTCISHAAMVGAIYAALIDLNSTLGAVIASVTAAASLSLIKPYRTRLDSNVGLSAVFSLMLGLTFLGVGLEQGSRNEMLSLLWGNVLFSDWTTVTITSAATALLLIFALAFNKELKALLFSRSIAAASGIHEQFVYFLLLCITGITLAVNIKAVGGLLIFSLISNPAGAAYQLFTGFRAIILASITAGVLSTLVGFTLSYTLDLPTGACIVLTSTSLLGLALLLRKILKLRD